MIRNKRCSRVPAVTSLAIAMLLVACGGGRPPETGASPGRPPVRDSIASLDPAHAYLTAGLLARSGMFPLVGTVGFFASASPDSTIALVTFSFPNRVLTFNREGDRYKASYIVKLDDRVNSTTVHHVDATESVRVATFRETERVDESVIFQQVLKMAPGTHVLSMAVRDEASTHAAELEDTLVVPRTSAGTLSSAIAVNQVTPRSSLDSLTQIITAPRATAVFGRDSAFSVYVEGYGITGARMPLRATIIADDGALLWSDSVSVDQHGALYSGTIEVPLRDLGLGVVTLKLVRGSSDSTRVPLFVSFDEQLPVASFDVMLSYLRYFATPERLDSLRDAPPSQRAAAWAAFLHDTDPVPTTPQHEGLTEYFARMGQANERYTEGFTQGWLTDRGEVYITIGQPDQIYEQGGTDNTHLRRTQVWEYRQYQLQLVFVDQAGIGRWRLTPTSTAQFMAVVRRIQSH